MWRTDLSILSRFTLFHGVLVLAMLLCDTADFCNASDSSCGLQIPSTTIVRTFKQKCYHFIRDEMYWTTARNFCTKYGAHLAKNNDEETNDFLSTALNSITWWQNDGVWIGLHDRNKEFQWEWTTGKAGVDEPVSWTNWASGHPSSILHTQRNCVRMKRSHGRWLWVDTPCETLRWHYRFICEYEFPEAENSNAAESLDATNLEGDPRENTDETGSGFYYSGIILIALLSVAILTCCICNIYIFCQRRKAGHMGVAGIWPFSFITLPSRTFVARAEPNTYATLEMLAIRKPEKASSDSDAAQQENLYWPMDGSGQCNQQSVYLQMGNASSLSGCLSAMSENVLVDSRTTQLSDLYVEPRTVVKRKNDNEVMGYEIPLPNDIYLTPRTTTKKENDDEMMKYDIPRPQFMHFERRAIRNTAIDQSTYVEHGNSVQRENTYEKIEPSEPKMMVVNGTPGIRNKDFDTYMYASADEQCVKSECERRVSNHRHSEFPEADIQNGHIYELLDDFKIQFSP